MSFYYPNIYMTKIYLIFIKLAVFVFLLPLVLEGNDDKTDEDVDHEEGNDDDVDEVENSDCWTMVVNRTVRLLVRVNWLVQQSKVRQQEILTSWVYVQVDLISFRSKQTTCTTAYDIFMALRKY